MQAFVDAMRIAPSLRVLVGNVEMAPTALLDRQLARLSGVDLSSIRYRRLGNEHADRIDRAMDTIEDIADRMAFVQAPFTLENIADAADEFEADLLLLDYIQRIPPPGEYADRRGSVDATMNYLRQFADAGMAVIVVSAVGRGKDSRGRSSYDGDALGLASFRESSELEFGADDAFLLATDPKDRDKVRLRHLKARNSEPRDLDMRFCRPIQRFSIDGDENVGANPENPSVRRELANMWGHNSGSEDPNGGAE